MALSSGPVAEPSTATGGVVAPVMGTVKLTSSE